MYAEILVNRQALYLDSLFARLHAMIATIGEKLDTSPSRLEDLMPLAPVPPPDQRWMRDFLSKPVNYIVHGSTYELRVERRAGASCGLAWASVTCLRLSPVALWFLVAGCFSTVGQPRNTRIRSSEGPVPVSSSRGRRTRSNDQRQRRFRLLGALPTDRPATLDPPDGTITDGDTRGHADARDRLLQGEQSSGVFAPRGWHCEVLYGSGSSHLRVTPTARDAPYFPIAKIRGSVVELEYAFGGFSGRFTVAVYASRLFPRTAACSIEHVQQEGLEPALDFERGPYPYDSGEVSG